MGNIFKNAAVVLGVLLLSTLIYFVVSDNQQLKEDVFDRSLNLLGQQLLALLPDDQQREVVAAKWKKVIDRVDRGEVQPEQVERMAVGILNASNLDDQISIEEADMILNLAYEDPDVLVNSDFPAPPSPQKAFDRKIAGDNLRQKLQAVGKKIETVCIFNTKIKSSCDSDPMKLKVFVQNLRYELSNGIRLNADMNFKHELNSQNFLTWKQELKKLEEERLLAWQQNFSADLAKAESELQVHLDSLRSAMAIQHAQHMEHQIKGIVIAAERLDELKKLEKLQQWQVVEPMAVKKVVYENIEQLHKTPPQPPERDVRES